MTTIAYREGILACDSCWSADNAVDTLTTKIYRLKSGALLGQAGANDGRPIINLLNTVKTVRGLPSYEAIGAIRLNAIALLILPCRTIVKIETTLTPPANWDAEVDHFGLWEVGSGFAAVGSGEPWAVAAMEAGASARQAVRIACRRDLNSRPPVHTLQFPKV